MLKVILNDQIIASWITILPLVDMTRSKWKKIPLHLQLTEKRLRKEYPTTVII